MKPGMRMLAAATARRGGNNDYGNYDRPDNAYRRINNGGVDNYEGRGYARTEYNGSGYNDGGVEGRFRDRRGREHYDNGRFAPARQEMPMDAMGEMTRRNADMYAPRMPYSDWDDDDRWGEQRGMYPIGFRMGGHGHSGKVVPMRGHASGDMDRLDRETADEWMSKLHNSDGTSGPHWTMEQVKQIAKQKGLSMEPVELYAVLNALYSDYDHVLKKHGISNIDVYVDLAKAWIEDKDAVPNKALMYYECIVK